MAMRVNLDRVLDILSRRSWGLGGTLPSLGAAAIAAVMGSPLTAAPHGEQVVAGSAQFSRQGDVTQITAANNTIIDYRGFDIATHETVQFIQPNANARVLNRIDSGDPTHIDGTLLGNGRVYISNPYGIYFGGQSVVNVASLYAAAAQITNADFLANVDQFTQISGDVVNNGTINADVVGLIGKHVANHGSIVAGDGLVMLAAGDEVLLGERNGRIMVKITTVDDDGSEASAGETVGITEASDSLAGVENTGTINASRGRVSMGAGDIYSLAIRQTRTGSVKAQEVAIDGGASGVVEVSGTLDATNDAGSGGSVAVLGDKVALIAAEIDASGGGAVSSDGGQVLIGGDYQGQGDVRTASRTFVGPDTTITADAGDVGDGGKVIVWADEYTGYYGSISARGGSFFGDGGLAEVSGKELLSYHGSTDLSSVNGAVGTLLLDPTDLTIIDGLSGDGNADTLLPDIFAADPPDTATVSSGAIEIALEFNDVRLEATNSITLNDLADNDLGPDEAFSNFGQTLTIIADSDNNGVGDFVVTDLNDVIRTFGGGSVTIQGANLTIGSINTQGGEIGLTTTSATGAINVIANSVGLTGPVSFNTGGDVTVDNGAVSIDLATSDISGALMVDAGPITVSGKLTVGGEVDLNASGDIIINAAIDPPTLDLTSTGHITINVLEADNQITVTAGDTTGIGNVEFTAGGSVTTFNGTSVLADPGIDSNIHITAGAVDGQIINLPDGGVVATSGDPFNDPARVTLTARAGEIDTTDVGSTAEINVQGELILEAASVGVGGTDTLAIQNVTDLTVIDTGVGEIDIREVGSPTITDTSITVQGVNFSDIDIVYADTDVVEITNASNTLTLDTVDLRDKAHDFSFTYDNTDATNSNVGVGLGSIRLADTGTSNLGITLEGNGAIVLGSSAIAGGSANDGTVALVARDGSIREPLVATQVNISFGSSSDNLGLGVGALVLEARAIGDTGIDGEIRFRGAGSLTITDTGPDTGVETIAVQEVVSNSDQDSDLASITINVGGNGFGDIVVDYLPASDLSQGLISGLPTRPVDWRSTVSSFHRLGREMMAILISPSRR